MFLNEEYESGSSSRIHHYKIASELKKFNLSRSGSKCYRIPENEQDQTEETMNIFECENIEKMPETFIETAKEYDIVGYKIVKSTTLKKDKRKLIRKNTESAGSRHSKSSNSLPTLDRGLIPKENLLEQLQRI
jgi:hypothetical protein